jgi:hypothetical protein
VQKSVPVKLARLLLDITIGCCFDSHPRIDSVLQNSGFRYGLLENAIKTHGTIAKCAVNLTKVRWFDRYLPIVTTKQQITGLLGA